MKLRGGLAHPKHGLDRLAVASPPGRRRFPLLPKLLHGLSLAQVVGAQLQQRLAPSSGSCEPWRKVALWAIWFRADSPENNQNLEEVRLLIGHHRVDAAVNAASRLIARAPKYAEAYNQRAIALFIQGRFAESAEDCQRVLKLNPYHVGAISGLAQCQIQLNQPHEALRTLRRAAKLQPHSQSIRENIQVLEAQIESDGTR